MATATVEEVCVAEEAVLPPPCLYCGSEDFVPLYGGIRDRLGHAKGEWSFVRCGDCGSANLRPFPHSEDLASFYPPVYTFSPEVARSRFSRLLATLEYHSFFRPVYRKQVRIVNRHLQRQGHQPGRLLDLGCGRGLRLLEFQQLGYEVHGLDIAAEAIEYLRAEHNVPAVCGDAAELTAHFSPGTFDVITAFHTLEHVLDVQLVLQQCLEALRPGGYLAISVPTIDCGQASWLGKSWITFTEAPRHITVPSRRGLTTGLVQAGFAESSIRFAADSTLSCAGFVGLSLLPGSATSIAYARSKYRDMAMRLMGAGSALVALPWAWIDKLLGRSASIVVFAQKPA